MTTSISPSTMSNKASSQGREESIPLLHSNKNKMAEGIDNAPDISSTMISANNQFISKEATRKITCNAITTKVLEIANEHKGLFIGTATATLLLVLLGTLLWKDKFGWEAWITIITVYCTFIALIMGVWTTELVIMANASCLLVFQIITPSEALEGFSNPSVCFSPPFPSFNSLL
jgi:hypothetical protein